MTVFSLFAPFGSNRPIVKFPIKMKVPKVLSSVKYNLAVVNGIFVLTGIILLIVGILVLERNSNYDELITYRFFVLPALAVGTGVFIIFISVLGSFAAISEKFYFIIAYVVLMLIVLVLELSVTITAFKLEKETSTRIRAPMEASLKYYETKRDVTKIWDDLQRDNVTMNDNSPPVSRNCQSTWWEACQRFVFRFVVATRGLFSPNGYVLGAMWPSHCHFNLHIFPAMSFQCCGVDSVNSWHRDRIPLSCCYIEYGTTSEFRCNTDVAYAEGCRTALGAWLSHNAHVLAVTVFILTCIQAVLVGISSWLAWRAKSKY
ncbi:hypothetical protein MSG28_003621 [Choristoneura fumiferana]|uniref:Uncharacterized protein n=1 Tax=Choristoneura fumiferana TaxID=7141 RepID=A0ACC0KFP5_CHOFU|nr:hypothetical protein MSG28_003621 [Choristoneura fumiferana]